jgi:hypothetical protein
VRDRSLTRTTGPSLVQVSRRDGMQRWAREMFEQRDRDCIPERDDDESQDPAALEAKRLALEDQAELYRACIWGVAFAVIVAGWAGVLGWLGWHLRQWLGAVLVLALLVVPASADTARHPVSVAESLGWAVAPVALDYAASERCFQRNPNCYESNIALSQHRWMAAVVVAGTTLGDQWLSRHSRRLMWAVRIARGLYHGYNALHALALAGR